MSQDILLFLYDEDTNEFFILAGKKVRLEITIYSIFSVEVEISDEI